MSIREVTMYQVACDAPDCAIKTGDLGLQDDTVAWSDTGTAIQNWTDAEALATEDGQHYCHIHVRWCRACEQVEIPYHDGAPELCGDCAGGAS